MMAYTKQQLITALQGTAARYGIDPGIAYNQINQESGFNPNVRSSTGAQGIAQFMPGTAARYGLSNPYDPMASFEAWGRYMRDLLDIFYDRYDLALAGYNWGEERAKLDKALSEGKDIRNYSIPTQTRNYLNVILGAMGTQPAPTAQPVPTTQAEAATQAPSVDQTVIPTQAPASDQTDSSSTQNNSTVIGLSAAAAIGGLALLFLVMD